MSKLMVGRRQFLRDSMRLLAGLGIAATAFGPLGEPFLNEVAAEELAPGGTYRATGFYERTAIGKETLVALVLVPVNGVTPPSIQDGAGLERRDLGVGRLEAFEGRVGGMHRKVVFEHGALLAVVYSARTPQGDYAEEKRYLFGRTELGVESPRERAARTEGRGNDGGGGAGGGM